MDATSKTRRRPQGVLDQYLHEISADALLSAAEEVQLAEASRSGDTAARSHLIRANLRLVVRIAHDFRNRGLSIEDLIGEGNLGLIRAVTEFDPRFGTRFSTYASHWIKQAIRHALINTTATIRLPAHMVGLLTKWRRAERAFLREFGYPPSLDQTAVSLGLTDAKRGLVEQALQAGRLLQPSTSEDENWSLEEATDDRESPESPVFAGEEHDELQRRLARLDDRERLVLTLRFGLGGQTAMTLKEVGRRLGVTREWVRKIEIRAVKKLNDPEINSIRRASAKSQSVSRLRRSTRVVRTPRQVEIAVHCA